MPVSTRFDTYLTESATSSTIPLRLTDPGFAHYSDRSGTAWIEIHAIHTESWRRCCMGVQYILGSLHQNHTLHFGRRDGFVTRTLADVYAYWRTRCQPDRDWRRELTPAHFWFYLQMCLDEDWIEIVSHT